MAVERRGVNLKRLAHLLMAVCALISAVILGFIGLEIGIAYKNTSIIEAKAKGGDANAQRVLAYGYESGVLQYYSLGRIRQNREKAIYWYEKSARQGNAKACFQLAKLYERESRNLRNANALYWYKEAVRLGSSDAEARLSALDSRI